MGCFLISAGGTGKSDAGLEHGSRRHHAAVIMAYNFNQLSTVGQAGPGTKRKHLLTTFGILLHPFAPNLTLRCFSLLQWRRGHPVRPRTVASRLLGLRGSRRSWCTPRWCTLRVSRRESTRREARSRHYYPRHGPGPGPRSRRVEVKGGRASHWFLTGYWGGKAIQEASSLVCS